MTDQTIRDIQALLVQYAKRVQAYQRFDIIDASKVPVDNAEHMAWWTFGVQCGLTKALKIVREEVGQDVLDEIEDFLGREG